MLAGEEGIDRRLVEKIQLGVAGGAHGRDSWGRQTPRRNNPHICGKLASTPTDREGNTMSRLTIDVTDQQHQALKAMAALAGKSIKQYTLERLFPPATPKDGALEELKLLIAERVAEAQRGEIVQGRIRDIAEEALLANGKR